jgi:decaprenylphospho-beta-D-ribofuranose 2-oxidase
MKLTGWGQYPIFEAAVFAPRSVEEVVERIQLGNAIPRGNGRAYGDSAISLSNTIDMKHFNKLLGFNSETGQLIAQSGVLLADVIDTFLPKGWFPSVTPGTKFVTIGGMVAADVHGKNHHKHGSFGSFIDWLDVVTADGDIKRCSREQDPELFDWTIGGMGLTGVVLRIAFRLAPVSTAWIKKTTIPARNIEHAMTIFESMGDATYSVAWIDCLSQGKDLGRSLIMTGEHAETGDLPEATQRAPLQSPNTKKITVPFNFPSVTLNGFTVKLFNALYYWIGKQRTKPSLVTWDSYFYPLDGILGWNKIYGRRGFAQFQCVIPLDQASNGINALLQAISTASAGSFLAVLKRFGNQNSRFSFPMAGYTLALDFPITEPNLKLMSQLDDITIQYGGRFYLAKDSRMTASSFKQSEPRLAQFKAFQLQRDANRTLTSEQAIRLDL